MNAVAPQQSVRMAAHQPEVHRPIQRATPALCVSTQGLDSTEVATAASVQQLDALKQTFEKDLVSLPPFALPLRNTATADLPGPSGYPCYVRSKRAQSALRDLRSGPV